MAPQNATKSKIRQCSLLKTDQFQTESLETPLSFIQTFQLIDKILDVNRNHPSLEKFRDLAKLDPESNFSIEKGLVLYQGKLVVPEGHVLIVDLIKEAHDQPSVAHPGCKKPYIYFKIVIIGKECTPLLKDS